MMRSPACQRFETMKKNRPEKFPAGGIANCLSCHSPWLKAGPDAALFS
jgi:hypothetical protein